MLGGLARPPFQLCPFGIGGAHGVALPADTARASPECHHRCCGESHPPDRASLVGGGGRGRDGLGGRQVGPVVWIIPGRARASRTAAAASIVPARQSATARTPAPWPRGRCRRAARRPTSGSSAGSPWRCACTRRGVRTGSCRPASGTAVSGSGCGALPSGRCGCCCCCGTCSRAVCRSPNEHPRLPPLPAPLRPHPWPLHPRHPLLRRPNLLRRPGSRAPWCSPPPNDNPALLPARAMPAMHHARAPVASSA